VSRRTIKDVQPEEKIMNRRELLVGGVALAGAALASIECLS
jgi:hypothetical protein